MNRLLVAPWHGLISDSLIHLANGETKAVRQPPNNPWGVNGPGDTHKIRVPGIAALTPEEVAATPLGGYYRVGESLISSDQLYGVEGLSWIYQDEAGGKWAIQINNASVLATFSSIRLDFSRFGEFGKAVEVYNRPFIIPKGQPNGSDLNRIFVPKGFNTGAVRLHAVSESGRTAIVTLSAFNAPGTEANAAKTDTRRRDYLYVKFSLSGTGPQVNAEMSILYSDAAIYSNTELEFIGGWAQAINGSPPAEEVEREPLYTEEGVRYADRVSYESNGPVPMREVNPGVNTLRTSWRYSTLEKWLVRVQFDGETPVPCYVKNLRQFDSSEMTFEMQTLRPQIMIEYLNGGNQTEQEGQYLTTGGGSVTGSSALSWYGPGESWSRVMGFASSAMYDGAATHITTTRDGVTESFVQPFLTDMQYEEFPLDTSPLPNFVGQPGVRDWRLVFYSNNLLAIIRTKADNTARFDSVITIEGAESHDAPCPQDQRHFGSYNPITGEFVVGSPVPVNWA